MVGRKQLMLVIVVALGVPVTLYLGFAWFLASYGRWWEALMFLSIGYVWLVIYIIKEALKWKPRTPPTQR